MIRLCMFSSLATLLATLPASAAAPDCRDTVAAFEFWRPVREQAEQTMAAADELAPELVGCLASPDPELRDTIAYELFTRWLRGETLSNDTRALLLKALETRLADTGGNAVLARSFAALVLAELMRSDAVRPFMTDADRESLLTLASAALAGESDYRGLDGEVGWVHPVAHMADLLWRFALHPATSADQARVLLDAVSAKVAPPGVSYSFNEGDRLARVVATIVRRELLPPAEVAAWLRRYAAPQMMDRWSAAFRSRAGMAELHDTKQFLRALSDQLDGDGIAPEISAVLGELVQGFTQLI